MWESTRRKNNKPPFVQGCGKALEERIASHLLCKGVGKQVETAKRAAPGARRERMWETALRRQSESPNVAFCEGRLCVSHPCSIRIFAFVALHWS